jgi:multiple sugar transport system ATP-binding protein
MARVQFEHVYKRFGNIDIVHDINLDIHDKEFLVLVGPSGCGKSTSLRMVAGLEEPSEGKIFIGDSLANGIDPKDRNIAMVFQNYALYPHMTVFGNMAFCLKLQHLPKQEIEKRIEEAASLLGLEQLLNRKPRELSGGQRQRVALGRAIVRDAQVFLMDEPLSNLDAKLRVATRAEIIKLHQRIQTTVIYVTHDQVEAMTMGDRIAVLSGGSIQQLGTPQALYDHPANIFVAGFIGSPAMNFIPGAQVITEENSTFIVLKGIGHVLVPPYYAERARASVGHHLTFGIRPAHLEHVEPISSESTIDGTVEVVENLGNELQVYLTAGDKSLIATLNPRSRLSVGDKVRLSVDSDQMHLFNSDTGQTIF